MYTYNKFSCIWIKIARSLLKNFLSDFNKITHSINSACLDTNKFSWRYPLSKPIKSAFMPYFYPFQIYVRLEEKMPGLVPA